MTLHITEMLVDLGPQGLFALTLGDAFYFPLPSQLYGYARWHQEGGAVHDRFALCMRHLPRATLLETLAAQRARLASAVPSVQGRVDWCAGQISDDYLESPSAAASMGQGVVILLFAGVAGQALFRIVDIPANRIISEETAASLCQRLKIKIPAYAQGLLAQAQLIASGSGYAFLLLGLQSKLLKLDHGKLTLSGIAHSDNIAQAVFSADFFFHDDNSSTICELVPLHADKPAHRYPPKYDKKAYRAFAAAAGMNRFAIGHQGGTVELIDGHGMFIDALRPNPRAPTDDQMHLSLSYAGNFLMAASWSGARVIDIDGKRVAEFAVPMDEEDSSLDQAHFSADLKYRASYMVTDHGVFTLSQKNLSHVTFSELTWQPLIIPARSSGEAGATASKGVLTKLVDKIRGRKKLPAYQKVLKNLVKPALALKETNKKQGENSSMYGTPSLPNDVAWPEYAGHKMLMLCQIDLSAAASLLTENLLPPAGVLMFFVSVDSEGEILQDEQFHPQAVSVLWLPQAVSEQGVVSHSGSGIAPRPMCLVKDKSELPQTDAAIIEAQLFSDDELEEYRAFFETTLPDGLSSGIRLGGYPATLQNNSLEAQAEYARSGQYPERDQHGWTNAARWRLLLQVDTDDEIMWGTDSGMLYFMIHDDDLRKRDFSRVVGLCAGL
ncbi:DUF1963 domain-containing protein [Undibacterium sp. Di27W]|uniref:DUF1963 domain-containing protein n=1 Tax=Undibacterium sp. Di27W TaxID=3413036 RepID=UPI003BF14A65